jgi:hypothetical protein
MRRHRFGEAGQAGGVEALAFGFLVLVVGALLAANVWGAVDARTAADAAAREAARAYVEASSGDDAATAARQAARDAVVAVGRSPDRMTLMLRADAAFARCTRVTSEVRYAVPLIRVPWVGSAGRAVTVVGRHSEMVDPFRSAVPGEATCGARY